MAVITSRLLDRPLQTLVFAAVRNPSRPAQFTGAFLEHRVESADGALLDHLRALIVRCRVGHLPGSLGLLSIQPARHAPPLDKGRRKSRHSSRSRHPVC